MAFDSEYLLTQIQQIEPEQNTGKSSLISVITFVWGEERYAVPLTGVSAVTKVAPITPLPGLPPTVLGAMNLSGEIIAVIDLRSLLGLAAGHPSGASRLIIVAHQSERLGLLVDAIGDIHEVSASDHSSTTSDLILGQTLLPDGEILNLLDLPRTLATLATV